MDSVDRDTHVYPAVLQSRPVLSQAQDKQTHVVLFPASQTEAEAPLAAFQLHHKTALQFTGTSTNNLTITDRNVI